MFVGKLVNWKISKPKELILVARSTFSKKNGGRQCGDLHLHSFAKKYRKTIILNANLDLIFLKNNLDIPLAYPSR